MILIQITWNLCEFYHSETITAPCSNSLFTGRNCPTHASWPTRRLQSRTPELKSSAHHWPILWIQVYCRFWNIFYLLIVQLIIYFLITTTCPCFPDSTVVVDVLNFRQCSNKNVLEFTFLLAFPPVCSSGLNVTLWVEVGRIALRGTGLATLPRKVCLEAYRYSLEVA